MVCHPSVRRVHVLPDASPHKNANHSVKRTKRSDFGERVRTGSKNQFTREVELAPCQRFYSHVSCGKAVRTWSKARLAAWSQRHSNPNAFYYRFPGARCFFFWAPRLIVIAALQTPARYKTWDSGPKRKKTYGLRNITSSRRRYIYSLLLQRD